MFEWCGVNILVFLRARKLYKYGIVTPPIRLCTIPHLAQPAFLACRLPFSAFNAIIEALRIMLSMERFDLLVNFLDLVHHHGAARRHDPAGDASRFV